MSQSKYAVTVIGAGSWGTALAMHIARCGFATCLWGRETPALELMKLERCNSSYLAEITFPKSLQIEVDFNTAVTHAEIILIAVPSHGFEDIIQQLAAVIQEDTPIISATKGIDPGSNELLHTVIFRYFNENYPFAILSGPSFAKEVALGMPTAVMVASPNDALLQRASQLLHTEYFRIYRSTDYIGVQLCGAVKNVIAIAAGVSDGLGYGANARAALITRGLAEMTRLGLAMGASPETFMSLAGVGDLVLTCTDNQSRNRRFGLLIGKGMTMQQAAHEIGQVVEGKDTVAQLCHLAERYHVDMPITQRVQALLLGKETADMAVMILLARPPRG